MKQFIAPLALVPLLALLFSGTVAAQTDSPTGTPPAGESAREISAPIEKLHDALLAVMKKAKTQDVPARFDILKPVLAESFDMRLMTALSTGTHWRKAPKDLQGKLVDAFQRFSVATYAARFDGWSGQSFETLGVQDGPRGTRLVRTRINRPSDEPVPLSYVVRRIDGQWRIIDILLSTGISEIAVRRSEYSAILKSDGIPALTRLLTEKSNKILDQ